MAIADDDARAETTVTVDRAGDYVLALVVSDGALESAPDTLRIVVTEPEDGNRAPVAVIERWTDPPEPGEIALYGGYSSDPDGGPPSPTAGVWWTRRSSPTGSDSSSPHEYPDLPPETELPDLGPPLLAAETSNVYVDLLALEDGREVIVELVVNDGTLDSAPVRETIRVRAVKPRPVITLTGGGPVCRPIRSIAYLGNRGGFVRELPNEHVLHILSIDLRTESFFYSHRNDQRTQYAVVHGGRRYELADIPSGPTEQTRASTPRAATGTR